MDDRNENAAENRVETLTPAELHALRDEMGRDGQAMEDELKRRDDDKVTVIPPGESLRAIASPGRPPAMVEADTDEQLIDLGLHGRAERTKRAYGANAITFLTFAGKPLRQITLNDLQPYQDSLIGRSCTDRRPRSSSRRSCKRPGSQSPTHNYFL